MHHKSFAILFILAVLLISPTIPAQANSITIDSAFRMVYASTSLSPPAEAETSSLGLFSETADGSTSTEFGLLLATASQISDISLLDNILTVNGAGSTALSVPEFPLPTSDDESIGPSVDVGSHLMLQFTIDNWAAYEAHSFLTSAGPFSRSFVGLGNLNTSIFSLDTYNNNGNIHDSRSGLLSPGTYHYSWFPTGYNLAPDSTGGVGSVFSSLTVTNVPEPSTLLLLACGLALLIVWRARQAIRVARHSRPLY